MHWLKNRSIRKQLIILVILNAALIIISVISVNLSIRQQNYDAVFVNLAGRQRMLTQRMTKSSLALSSPHATKAQKMEMLSILKESSRLYGETLEMFIHGGTTTLSNLPVSTPPLKRHLEALADLEDNWHGFQKDINIVIEEADSNVDLVSDTASSALNRIVGSNEILLWKTDQIVTFLQIDAEAHVSLLKRSMYLILLLEFILILFFFKVINTGIIQPFNRLIDAIGAIGRGERFAQHSDEHYYEWQLTFENIASMDEHLTDATATLYDLNKSLEQKVIERTSDLETTIAQLEDTYQRLMETEKQASLGVLVAGVAHEVNTPLGACITGSSQMVMENQALIRKLETGGLSKEDFIDYINTNTEIVKLVDFNLNRAADIIRSFKRIAVHQSADIESSFYLDEYIDDLWISLSHIHKKYDAVFINHLPHQLILADPGDYSQIFSNLFINTFTHGYEPGDKTQIDVTGRIEKGLLSIQYRDYGKGIPSDNLPKIFDPFYTTNRSGGGSGLGLNVIYQIIHTKLDGHIECHSEIGNYTEFTFTIKHFKEGGKS